MVFRLCKPAVAAVLFLGLLACLPPGRAHAQQPGTLQPVRYLLAAPRTLPAYAPWVLADGLGYYAAAGYSLQFMVGQGGVDVAKQVAFGNADLGNAIGDTPIIVRPNGIMVRDVAVMGGGALTVITARGDRGIRSVKDLKGKTIVTLSYQDTTYYALLGVLHSVGLGKQDVRIEAVGPGGMTSFVKSGRADACACVPEWDVDIHQALPDAISFPSQDYVPSMAQAILASDKMIGEKPEMIRAVVSATLRAMDYIRTNPEQAADAYIKLVPAQASRRDFIVAVFRRYAELEYKKQPTDGMADRDALQKLQQFYVSQGLVKTPVPVEQLYDNRFVTAK